MKLTPVNGTDRVDLTLDIVIHPTVDTLNLRLLPTATYSASSMASFDLPAAAAARLTPAVSWTTCAATTATCNPTLLGCAGGLLDRPSGITTKSITEILAT